MYEKKLCAKRRKGIGIRKDLISKGMESSTIRNQSPYEAVRTCSIGSWKTSPIGFSAKIRPQSANSKPRIIRSRVDFPHPFGPTTIHNCPGGTSKEIPYQRKSTLIVIGIPPENRQIQKVPARNVRSHPEICCSEHCLPPSPTSPTEKLATQSLTFQNLPPIRPSKPQISHHDRTGFWDRIRHRHVHPRRCPPPPSTTPIMTISNPTIPRINPPFMTERTQWTSYESHPLFNPSTSSSRKSQQQPNTLQHQTREAETIWARVVNRRVDTENNLDSHFFLPLQDSPHLSVFCAPLPLPPQNLKKKLAHTYQPMDIQNTCYVMNHS